MSPFAWSVRRGRAVAWLGLALVAVLVLSLPAAAFSSAWTKPKRVVAADGQPNHASVVDGGGHVHVATQKGDEGIFYSTNRSGSWQTCRLSEGKDRFPSITVEGDVIHVAFARFDAGEKGLYTAHSDQAAGTAAGCGWAIVKRAAGGASSSAIGIRAGTLHIAFRTATRKLKYYRGKPGASDWTVKETIDGYCCTSAPALYFTTAGAPRVAYGDGGKRADGLKFAVRSSNGWKKSRASGGRVKHVAMVLDYSPGVFTPPSNAPFIAYVVKKRGTYMSVKAAPNAKGAWNTRYLGRWFGQTGISTWSNNTTVILSGGGKLVSLLFRGGILFSTPISSNGKDGKPRYVGGRLTFSRKGSGVYFSQPG